MLDGVAFYIGFFPVRWYAISYLAGLAAVWGLLWWRARRGETTMYLDGKWEDAIFFGLVGGLVGGRLGYAILYAHEYFWCHPLEIFVPFHDGKYVGISGMSFFGGIIGAAVAVFLWTRARKVPFWEITDYIAPAIPVAIFFGRIGNLLNGELVGRASHAPWAMDFGDGTFRHPSQLYEAGLEGIALFAVLWTLRNKNPFPGFLSALFLLGYAAARFAAEFFRAPDPGSEFWFGFLTQGQIFSLAAAICGCVVLWRQRKFVV